MECHSTYAEKISAPEEEPESYDRNRIILGVDCERCHGTAAKHVEFHTKNPAETQGRFLNNIKGFTRTQSLDMCKLCHGGRLQKTKPSFQFTAGEKLSDYFLIDNAGIDAANIDVHGNQYGLLAASKCYKMSNALTCNTCHDPHANEKGNLALFSQRCISCHSSGHTDAVTCKMTAALGPAINQDCVSCHMPEQPSHAIAVLLQGASSPTPALMHTHLIKVYPEASKKRMAGFKKSMKK